MTQAQVIGEILISLCMLVVGAISSRVLKKIQERMNRPVPLTGQAKGQLLSALAMYEESLDRLSYLGGNSKDLFLYILQLLLFALLCSTMAALVYLTGIIDWRSHIVYMHQVLTFVLLVIAGVLSFFGIYEAGTMSNKKIGARKAAIQKKIDEIKERLKDVPLP